MKTIIIGDIHGCDQKLNAMLDKIQPGSEDRLILLGDLFDRGPDSWEVFQTVRKLDEALGDRFVLLKGNHEDYWLAEKLTLSQRLMWNAVGKSYGSELQTARCSDGGCPAFSAREMPTILAWRRNPSCTCWNQGLSYRG